MARVLVVYSTLGGGTKKIADLIAEGIRFSGHEATVEDVNAIKNESDIIGYDAYVFGSATYHGEMMGKMKTFLFIAGKAGLDGKPGGAFGAFGWSGEAPDRIFETMRNVFNMEMVSQALRLKSAALQGGTQMAQDYGRDIAKKLA